MAKPIYGVLLTRDEEGGWGFTVPYLPGCFTFGESRMEALAQAGDAMRTYVAALLEQGDQPPRAHKHPVTKGLGVCLRLFRDQRRLRASWTACLRSRSRTPIGGKPRQNNEND